MKFREFSLLEKKRRKKPRRAAYGPGPYGGYGYLSGYSGDGGGSVGEASYEGNIGMMEVTKFFRVANEAQKKLLKDLMIKGKRKLAWKLIQDVTKTKLQGQQFREDRTADVVFDTGEKKKVRYVPGRKDIIDMIVRYYLKQGLRVIKVDDEEIQWDQVSENFATRKQGVAENFADGKKKGRSRPGRVKRAGASCKGSVTDLRARAKNSSGEKAKMYHWCSNMKSGKK
jgi:hypothetical protein